MWTLDPEVFVSVSEDGDTLEGFSETHFIYLNVGEVST